MWQLDGFPRVASVAPEPAPVLPGGSLSSSSPRALSPPFSPSLAGLVTAPIRETAQAIQEAAATGKAALIDGTRWFIVGPGFEDIEHTASGSNPEKLRGVFYHEQGLRQRSQVCSSSPSTTRDARPQVQSGDFRQCLSLLVTNQDSARDIAFKLYPRFDGDLGKLPELLQLLEDKWGFPTRVFPLLWTQLRRTRGGTDSERHVNEQAWAEAFIRWLQVLWIRSSQTKVSRQCFVQTRSRRDLAKVYFMGALLGEGSYGQVHLALHTGLGVARVVKSVPKSQLEMAAEQVEDEVAALRAMDHPHIVRIFEAFETDGALHIVMDYAEGGDLASVIREHKEHSARGLPEAYVRTASGQILSALAYMHSKGVIHCDLKPQNVMLLRKCSPTDCAEGKDEPHLLLVDFGLSEIFEESPNKTKNVKGTPSYLAPEGFDGRLCHKSDAWSFGVVLFELLTGQRPFRGTSNVFLLFCQIMKEKPPLLELPLSAREVVGALLTKEPTERLSAEQCLQHSWFQSYFEDVREVKESVKALVPVALGCASYFYRMAMFCAASALGMKDVQSLFEAFQSIDTDKSGYLTRQQLTSGLQRFGIQRDPMMVMASLDLDQDGRISLTEFLAGAVRMDKEVSEGLLQLAFSFFDIDGNGYISTSDLQDLLTGDGPSSDMLPDGQTVDQVMEEVSRGEGQISFESFQTYLKNAAANSESLLRQDLRIPSAQSTNIRSAVEEMVDKLENRPTTVDESEHSTAPAEEQILPFPSFDQWVEELFRNTQEGAAFADGARGRLLVFEDGKLEASYAAQNLRSTLRRIALLAFGLLLYSAWALTTENDGWWPRWAPSVTRWDLPVVMANNVAWLLLFLLAVMVLMRCSSDLRQSLEGESRALQALRFEHFLCVTGCFFPWISCCLANRTRVSAIFGVQVDDVFESVNNDYDLIVTFLAALMFITTLTHVRMLAVLPIAVSCVLAFTVTSIIIDPEPTMSSSEENWVWPSLILLVVLTFSLWGHRTVEKHRRLTFLSLHASYRVLREAQEDTGGTTSKLLPSDSWANLEAGLDTRYARFKRCMDTVQKLAHSMDSHKPINVALCTLLEVLKDLRDDIAQVDGHHSVDIGAVLESRGLHGGTRDLLLGMFDALPGSAPGSEEETRRNESAISSGVKRLSRSGGISQHLSRSGGQQSLSLLLDDEDVPAGSWGWDLLSSRQDQNRVLMAAGEELLLPTVAAAATSDWCCGPKQAAAARARAAAFLEQLEKAYAQRHGAEVRAALAMRSAHWLAQRLGLWGRLEVWERVALLAAAAGLYSCGECEERGCALLPGHPLLAHAASLDCTLKALDASGLAELAAASNEKGVFLRRLVSQLMERVRPRFSLDDSYRVRVLLECDDGFPATCSDRALLAGLALSASNFAFLALPSAWHEPWAHLCQDEARWLLALRRDLRPCMEAERLDVGKLLRELIEVLAAPLYDTLAKVGEASSHIAVPLRHLRLNFKHWKVTELIATAAPAPSLTSTVAPSSWAGTTDSVKVPNKASQGEASQSMVMIQTRSGKLSEIHENNSEQEEDALQKTLREMTREQSIVDLTNEPVPNSLGGSPSVTPRAELGQRSMSRGSLPRGRSAQLGRGLRFYESEEEAAPEERLDMSQTLMSVKLPALSGDDDGMAVPATEEFLSRSLGAGKMMLLLVKEDQQGAGHSPRPRSALSSRATAAEAACSSRGAAVHRSLNNLRERFVLPSPTVESEEVKENPEQTPEPLVAWESAEAMDPPDSNPSAAGLLAAARGGAFDEPPAEPDMDCLDLTGVSLQSLLENVLAEP